MVAFQQQAEQVETCPVFEWLTSIAGRADEPVLVFGGNISGREFRC